MTELHQFLAMLNRSGVGYGTRIDHVDESTSVQVENDEGKPMIADFLFDKSGKLTSMTVYEAELG